MIDSGFNNVPGLIAIRMLLICHYALHTVPENCDCETQFFILF